jgi:hypothetical protein
LCKVAGKVVNGVFYYRVDHTINDHNHPPESHMRTYEPKPRAMPLKKVEKQPRPAWRDRSTGKLLPLGDDGSAAEASVAETEDVENEEQQRLADEANGIIWFKPKLRRAWDPPVIKAKDIKRDESTGYVVVSFFKSVSKPDHQTKVFY